MLKKLVKYGNSNALVLDKAILELLNIAEGSVLKISTDGTSIILTPQKKIESQQVQETYTNYQAMQDAAMQEMFKGCEATEESKQEYINIRKKFFKLREELCHNEDYIKETKALKETFADPTAEEFYKAYKALSYKFSPELERVEKEFVSYGENIKPKNKKTPPPTEKQKETMNQEFSTLFKKHGKVCQTYSDLSNNADYQHELQLIAEKYKNNNDSEKYLLAYEELMDKFAPEGKDLRAGIKAISKKYK